MAAERATERWAERTGTAGVLDPYYQAMRGLCEQSKAGGVEVGEVTSLALNFALVKVYEATFDLFFAGSGDPGIYVDIVERRLAAYRKAREGVWQGVLELFRLELFHFADDPLTTHEDEYREEALRDFCALLETTVGSGEVPAQLPSGS